MLQYNCDKGDILMCVDKRDIIELIERFEKLDKKKILFLIINIIIKILTSLLEKYIK